MRNIRIALGSALGIALLACDLCASAATPAAQAPVVQDIALADGGVLYGQVLTSEGVPLACVPVALLCGGQQIAQGQTDAAGNFAFSGLGGSVYQVVAADSVGAYRAWAPGTAPPTAQRGVMMVAGKDLVRGLRGGALRFWACNPWFVAGAITVGAGTGIAIAAVHDDDDGHPVSP